MGHCIVDPGGTHVALGILGTLHRTDGAVGDALRHQRQHLRAGDDDGRQVGDVRSAERARRVILAIRDFDKAGAGGRASTLSNLLLQRIQLLVETLSTGLGNAVSILGDCACVAQLPSYELALKILELSRWIK